jgi:L-asparagine transporter-like permease
LASVAVYLSIFVSFIVFRRKYYTLDKGRPFYNPVGKYKCATVGLLVFSLAAVGLCGFQNDSHVALIVFSAYAATMTVYYYAVSQKRQHFSAEEQAALLVAYIINSES